MKKIGLVCVKKKSSRFPDKHFQVFLDSNIFEHGLKELLRSEVLDLVYVVSDDERVWAVCSDKFTEKVIVVKEPRTLASLDDSWKVIRWFILREKLSDSTLLFYLPITAPLRSYEDIKKAWRLYLSKRCSSVVGVRKCPFPVEWAFQKTRDYLKIEGLKRPSQKCRERFLINGAIYISSVGDLKKYDGYFGAYCVPYLMPDWRSIDVDTPADLEKAIKFKKLYEVSE